MTTNIIVNGKPYAVNLSQLPADITLITFLREHAQLTATKFMCLEGGCGACICVVKVKHPATGQSHTMAVNSCLTLLNSCKDWEIITQEGIGNRRDGYHPIQKRMAKMNGSQCGFCTSGFIMNMYGLLESKKGKLTMEEVENSFAGNMCRCTGYRPILDTMKSFAVDSIIEVPQDCLDMEDLSARALCPKTGKMCFGTCHPTFTTLLYQGGEQWFWPKTVTDLFDILNKLESSDKYMLLAGNTAHGVYRRDPSINKFIDINGIPELHQHSIDLDKLTLGANLSLTEVMEIFTEAMKKSGFEYCNIIWKHFDLVAHIPVRNLGTLAGNISIKRAHAEFPSDIFLNFEALDAQVIVNYSASSRTKMSLMEYLSMPEKIHVITAFELKPYPKEKFVYKSYKIMPRAQNAHAMVNAAFLFEMNVNSGMVSNARICFGGIAPDYVHASEVEALVKEKNVYDSDVVSRIFHTLSTTIVPTPNLPDPSPEYRNKLACGLFYKFILSIAPKDKINPKYVSGGDIFHRPLSSGQQSFETNKENFPVGQPVEKLEAMIQCSGEANYINDIHTTSDSVFCAFVNATKVGATIEDIDASEALAMPGTIAFFSAKDIPGQNSFVDTALLFVADEIFCAGRVKYYEQPLGVIVGQTSDIANRAVTKVKVIYSNDGHVVRPTMASVIEANDTERIHTSCVSPLKAVHLSDTSDITTSGILEIGGQYHYTMEPHTTIVVPFDKGLKVWSATQWMDQTQAVIAKMLKMQLNDVQLEVRRLGGGYGAKISRGNQVACAASLVAYKLNRPARFVQTIESMMGSIGKRWALHSDYEFHVKSNGKIVGLKNSFYQDAGCNLNESPLPVSLEFAKNCYELTDLNFKIDGGTVITDAASSTWCRAPGTVEGIAMMENIIEHIAFETKLDPADVRIVNTKPGNKILDLLPGFIKSTEYRERRQQIDQYNEQNRWRKRGLGISVMEYPFTYMGEFPATVSIYRADGTVVITHGGIEMGQGINTKVAQVAAHTLGVPLDLIRIESSNTINGANSMITGGSVSSESVCYAVQKTCNVLNARLKPVKDSLKKDATWLQIVQTAWAKSINLIASDHYKTGDLQEYSIYGLAITEIEIDILTGNVLITRADILEDTGESLSPYVDVGQIEGGFVMLLGYWLSEHLVYDRQTGQLLTNRTWTYKPPGTKDIPIDFRVTLSQKNKSSGGFMRSKATAEPPSTLAVSVLFAVQHALQSARNDAGLKREWVRLGAPTTPEDIVLNSGSDVKNFLLT